MAAPEALYFTDDDEACRLLAADPFALLVGVALDQQVTVQQAFAGPLRLKQRLGTLDPTAIAGTDPAEVEAAFKEKPAIHRFPGSMAARVQDIARLVTDEYGGHAERLWLEAADNDDLRRRAAGVRRDDGANPRNDPREALRRAGGAGHLTRPHDARRRRLARVARGVSGGQARPQSGDARGQGLLIELRTLTDGGQTADEIVQLLAAWVSAAQRTLDIAIYDIRLPDPVGPVLLGALTEAARRGVTVRLAYNYEEDEHPMPVPVPPKTEPSLVDSLPFPTSCTTSTSCATRPPSGPARRTGRSIPGRARRT
jgi:hypothetical protein